MLRLRLKRLICFCLTLCLLFCSNMTVFALDEIHNTNEEEPYFNFSYKYYTNSNNYGYDSDSGSITRDCEYSNFFYKDLNDVGGTMKSFNVRLSCTNPNGKTRSIETTFDDFYTSNGAPVGLHLNTDNNADDIRNNLWFVKSLSNVNSIVDLLYLIPYSVPGCAFAYILTKTNNIFVPIGFHFLHNGVTMSLQILLLIFGG